MKQKIILFLVSVLIFVLSINSAYARYASSTDGTVSTDIARWQILVNDENITTNKSSSLTITPVIDENENVATGKIAPGSTGYFDIEIDPTNVDLSFMYNISAEANEDSPITDLKVTHYSIFNEGADTSNLEKNTLVDNNLQQIKKYNNSVQNFKFDKQVIRLYFMWDDNSLSSSMNDEEDTEAANSIDDENNSVSINVDISFEQYIE